jgi:hypothetical protein
VLVFVNSRTLSAREPTRDSSTVTFSQWFSPTFRTSTERKRSAGSKHTYRAFGRTVIICARLAPMLLPTSAISRGSSRGRTRSTAVASVGSQPDPLATARPIMLELG